jgi:predicted transcriptional regulator
VLALTVRDAEQDAVQLLDSSWWTSDTKDEPLPVDPLALARRLGIRVDTVPLPPDQSGNIVMPPSGTVVISLNARDHEHRRRFTCAHEIGHYLRRRETGALVQRFVDYGDTLAGLGVDAEEIYANQFAGALLMPGHLVQRWHGTHTVDMLARRFGTSAQAMEVRLRNLRLR